MKTDEHTHGNTRTRIGKDKEHTRPHTETQGDTRTHKETFGQTRNTQGRTRRRKETQGNRDHVEFSLWGVPCDAPWDTRQGPSGVLDAQVEFMATSRQHRGRVHRHRGRFDRTSGHACRRRGIYPDVDAMSGHAKIDKVCLAQTQFCSFIGALPQATPWSRQGLGAALARDHGMEREHIRFSSIC